MKTMETVREIFPYILFGCTAIIFLIVGMRKKPTPSSGSGSSGSGSGSSGNSNPNPPQTKTNSSKPLKEKWWWKILKGIFWLAILGGLGWFILKFQENRKTEEIARLRVALETVNQVQATEQWYLDWELLPGKHSNMRNLREQVGLEVQLQNDNFEKLEFIVNFEHAGVMAQAHYHLEPSQGKMIGPWSQDYPEPDSGIISLPVNPGGDRHGQFTDKDELTYSCHLYKVRKEVSKPMK